MKTILVLGAGRSSSSLIRYLLENAGPTSWKVLISDISEDAVRGKLGDNPFGEFIPFNIDDYDAGIETIRRADVVISLLPPPAHARVAMYCIAAKRHMLTASYVSPEMQSLHEEALKANIILLNECGLDPGIDHMSAMQVIDRIKDEGGQVLSFESFTGGLIAPETDPLNPWRYKFTWNPKNVVMAGQATARYLENGRVSYIPYHQLFRRTTQVTVPGLGEFEGYANRDSLKYIQLYGLHDAQTMQRGTLRYAGFCEAWDILVQLGCCDDSYEIKDTSGLTPRTFIESFLPAGTGSVRERVAKYLRLGNSSAGLDRLEWSGFFDDQPLPFEHPTPAQVTERILNKKWAMTDNDRDLVVMWHRFKYNQAGQTRTIEASLVATGENSTYTAMAQTVGLPLAIAAKLLLRDEIKARGVTIPITREFYDPILQELQSLGISLREVDY